MFRFTIRDLLWLMVVAALSVLAFKDSFTSKLPTIALDGFCPVTVVQDGKWATGKSEFSTVFGGQRYLFAGDVQRQIFLAMPERYAVKASGNDVVRLSEENRPSAGTRKYGVSRLDGLYLFDSENTRATFEKSPDKYKLK